MEVQVTGKNLNLGEALQTHVSERITDGVNKYFGDRAEASVIFAKERRNVECEITAHLASGVFLAAHGEAGDAYGAFEIALEKLEKRVRRYKRRLKNHHSNGKAPLPAEQAAYYLLAAPSEDPEGNDDADFDANPVVVAESLTALREMTVGDAVMQLDLAETPALVFKNAAHGRLNVVYRRRDGHIGWIDPTEAAS